MDTRNYQEMIESMESQLKSLYEEKAQSVDTATLTTALRSLEEQLIALYEDKQKDSQFGDTKQMRSMLENLETNVISLIEEKIELEEELKVIRARVEQTKLKAKALGSAIFEATLAVDLNSKAA